MISRYFISLHINITCLQNPRLSLQTPSWAGIINPALFDLRLDVYVCKLLTESNCLKYEDQGTLVDDDAVPLARRDADPEAAVFDSEWRSFRNGLKMPHQLQSSPRQLQAISERMLKSKSNVTLHRYQSERIGLMADLENKSNSATLADDMIFGQTFQLIVLMFTNTPHHSLPSRARSS